MAPERNSGSGTPFPGMDPFLEAAHDFADFHERFLNVWSELIADELPDGYDVRFFERVYLSDESVSRHIIPDLLISSGVAPTSSAVSGAQVVATVEPVNVPLIMPTSTVERALEIRHLPDLELVTVIELLSPSNKAGRGRDLYLQKRDEVIYSETNLVELDLLVGGRRPPMAAPLPPGDYFAFISRGDQRPQCQVYAWEMFWPLPVVPVPLRAADGDIRTDLAAVFRIAFQRGRYHRRIDYTSTPPVPARYHDPIRQTLSAVPR